MTLDRHLRTRIAAEGPISVADYMAEALLHPEWGYYTTRDPFGAAGDFTTAPEISQMFGELLGLCLAQAWLDQGAPGPMTLAELGPGRGTLMRDALRAMRAVPGLCPDVVLIEASPTLRAQQAETLAGHDPRWAATVDDLPDAPLLLVANEFFDALPIRQFQRDPPGWRELRVGLKDGRLTRGLGQRQTQPELDARFPETPAGKVVELCPALPGIVGEIGARIARHGGAALIVDYGGWHSCGDTLQAVQGHAPTDPFATPGQADLTAHVDFEAIAMAAAPARATTMIPQGVLLERLGIAARAQALAVGLSGPARAAHLAAYRRLTHPEEMGDLFKVIGLYPDSAPPPPGLDA